MKNKKPWYMRFNWFGERLKLGETALMDDTEKARAALPPEVVAAIDASSFLFRSYSFDYLKSADPDDRGVVMIFMPPGYTPFYLGNGDELFIWLDHCFPYLSEAQKELAATFVDNLAHTRTREKIRLKRKAEREALNNRGEWFSGI